MSHPFSLAIVGGGVSGLAAAWQLRKLHPQAKITLFESSTTLGGHANTVELALEGQTFGVDTGFLVYNERTYPKFIAMLNELGVRSHISDMGFSVQVPSEMGAAQDLEWAGNSLNAVFVQRKNLLSIAFWRMLVDMLRFNRLCTKLAAAYATKAKQAGAAKNCDTAQVAGSERETVGEFLHRHRFSQAFIDNYFLPMVACIWSCPTEQMLAFPIATMVRFCHNHGLLQIANRPQWYTIASGSRQYVSAIVQAMSQSNPVHFKLATKVHAAHRLGNQVSLDTQAGCLVFDGIIFACHSDQALQILSHGSGATDNEKAVLGAINYQENSAVLHTDTTLMPKNRIAWAAWNYEKTATVKDKTSSDHGSNEAVSSGQTINLPATNAVQHKQSQQNVCLHYWLNRLQPLPVKADLIVSLNPIRKPHPDSVIQAFTYAHPVFDQAAIDAQANLHSIQSKPGQPERTWFAGAWCKYGFHEDGFSSGLDAAHLAANALSPEPHLTTNEAA